MKKIILIISIIVYSCIMAIAQTILGIDVSALQGNINWSQVSSAGKTFAFVKSSKGTCYTDSKFFVNMVNGNTAGVKVGAYHFALPEDNSAIEEANFFLSIAGSYIGNGYLPPVLDLEDPAGTCLTNTQPLTNFFTSSALTTWVQTWMTTVQNATGIEPILYTSPNIASFLNSSLNGYKLWIANPNTSPSTPPTNIGNWTSWTFKQYDWYGNVSGINGNVDLNVFNGTTTAFNNLIGLGGQPDLTPINQSVSSTTVAAGSNITAYCAEDNSGNTAAPANITSIYLSADAILTPGSNGDTYIDFINFSSLAAGSNSTTNSKNILIPNGTTTGNYYLFFWADGGQVVTESIENNNFASVQISVTSSTTTYAISTTSNPLAGGTTGGSGFYSSGQQATVVATSNTGYTFVNWTENGIPITTNASYTFNVTGNRNLVANFTTCSFTLNNYNTSAISSATSGAFWVFTTPGCSWVATSSGCSGMITMLNSVGTGNGLVTFNISENLNTSPRSCTINVGSLVFTVNQAGYVSPCPNPPADPFNLTVNGLDPNVLYLTWNGNNTNVTNFEIERSLSATGPFYLIGVSGNYFGYPDSNIVSGTSYFYRVRGCCNSNCSNYTNIYSQQACTNSIPQTGLIVSTDSICQGESVVLEVQGGSLGTGASWIWRTDNCHVGSIVPNSNGSTITVSPQVSTYYFVHPENGACDIPMNCAYKAIIVNPMPYSSNIAANGPTEFCNGDNVTISGNLGGTWSNGETTESITVSTSGDYFVTNTNNCGSTTSNHILVTVSTLPTISIYSSLTNICIGDSITMSAIGASNYTWTGGVTNGIAFVPTLTDTYTVTGTDANGCTNIASETITVNQLPTVIANATATSICTGASVTLTGGGASTYTWTGGVTNDLAFNPTVTNTYTVTGTDANGCTNTDAKTINVNQLPTVVANATATSICTGASVTLTGGGANTYTWTDSVTNGVAFNPTATNSYTVTGTDANGCANTATETITVNQLPNVVANPTATSICIGASVTLTGGGAYTYTWTDSVTNGVAFNPTATNTYTVTGTDANGCTNTATETITINQLPNVVANATATSICIGANVTLTGGGANTYTWTDSVTNGIAFNPTTTNTYTVTGTDANGCSNIATNTITVNSLPVVDAGINISITQGNSTTIGGTPTASGNGSFVYSWTPSTNLSSTAIPNPLADPTITTTYFVSVTDGNGCSELDSILVTVNTIGCNYSTSDSSTSFNHLGGTHNFNLTTSNVTCTWTPINSNTWFQVNPTTQQTGNGTITITVDSCNNGIPRTGTFTIAGITYTVSQTCNVGTICNQPIADFLASQTSGNCPFTVDFFDQSQTTGAVNYQWTIYNGSGSPLTPTQQDPTGVLYNVAGSFLVKLQVTDSCGTDTKILANYIIVSCTPVGSDNIAQGINVAVYPNPTNEILNVIANDLPNDIYKVTLTDIIGKSLFDENLSVDNNKIEKQFDVKFLSNGIYLMTISSPNTRKVFKINKQ